MQLVLVLTMLRVPTPPLPIPVRLLSQLLPTVRVRKQPLRAVPQRLLPLRLRLERAQAMAGTRQEMGTRATREGKAVASVWGVNPGLGVTTD